MEDDQDKNDNDLDDIVKEYANEHLDDEIHPHEDADHGDEPGKEIQVEDLVSPTKAVKTEQAAKKLDTKAVFLRGATVKKDIKKKKKPVFTKDDYISKLERYEEYDKNHPDNQPFPSDENFKGPIALDKRKRTDFKWVIIYIIIMTAFFIYSVIVYKEGDSRRLIRGTDFRSEICGIGKLQERPFIYFANPTLDINVAFCVQSCPTTTGQKIFLYDVDGHTNTPFWYTQIESKPLGFNCLPVEPISKRIVDEHLSEISNTLKRVVGDMGHSSDIMGAGCALAVIFGYICLYMLKSGKGTKYVVWGSIWGTLFCFLTLCLMCWREYQRTIDFKCLFGIDKYGCGGIKATAFYWTTVALGIFGFLYLLLVMKLFNRINFAIGLIKTSSKVTNVLEQIKYIPFITISIAIVLGGYILTVIIFSISVGDIFVIPAKGIDGGFTKILVYTQTMRYLLVGAIIVFLFTLFIISAFADMVTCYCLCVWFFTKRSITLILPIKLALKIVVKYHLGTVIKSAFLFPIFATPKLILGWIRRRLRNRRQTSTLIKFVETSCFCCIHLNEKLMRYVSKHSYIQTAIFSRNFSDGGRLSFYLLNRHRNKVKDVDFLQEFVIFQTKICPSLLASLFVYIFISFGEKSIIGNTLSEVETPFGPSLFVLFIGYLYAAMFQGSFDIISKTVIQCYLLDGEMFIGDQRYVEPFIKEFMEYFGKEFDDKKIEVKSAIPENTAITRVNPDWKKEEEKQGEIHEEDVTDSDQSSKSSDSEEEEKPKPIDPLGTTMNSKNPNFLNADDFDKSRGLNPITTKAKQMKSAAFDPFGMEEKKDKSTKSALSRPETSQSIAPSLGGNPSKDPSQVSKSNFFEKQPERSKVPVPEIKKPSTDKSETRPLIITPPQKPLSNDGDRPDSKDSSTWKPNPNEIPKIQTSYNEVPKIKEKPKAAQDEWDFFNEKPQLNKNKPNPSNNVSDEVNESKTSKVEKSKDHIVATSWGDFDDNPKPKKLAPQNLAYTFAQPNLKMKDNQKILDNSNSGSAILDVNKRKPKEVDIWNFNNDSKVNDTMNFENSFDVDSSNVKKGFRKY